MEEKSEVYELRWCNLLGPLLANCLEWAIRSIDEAAVCGSVCRHWHLQLKHPKYCHNRIARVRARADISVPHSGSILMGLYRLDLAGSTYITDAGVQSLSVLANLQHLELSRCHHITDVGVQSLSVLANLQHLNLSGCKHITDAAVNFLHYVWGGKTNIVHHR